MINFLIFSFMLLSFTGKVQAQNSCCDLLTITKETGNDCRVKLVSECVIRSIEVTITNGKMSNPSWNCTDPIDQVSGVTTHLFYTNNACITNLAFDVSPNGPGEVQVAYFVNFTNGSRCQKDFFYTCSDQPLDCCEGITLNQTPGTTNCARITSTCAIKSVKIDVENGRIETLKWPCTGIGAGFENQTSFSIPSGGCPLDMNVCFIASNFTEVVATYTLELENGTICTKKITFPGLENPCPKVELLQVDGDCRVKIKTDVPLDYLDVEIENGTIAEAGWNCPYPMRNGVIGSSRYIFIGCATEFDFAIAPNPTGEVKINVKWLGKNQYECTESLVLNCVRPPDCCADMLVDVMEETGCVTLKSACEYEKIDVKVTNGWIVSSLVCGSVPNNGLFYHDIYQSDYTQQSFSCGLDLKWCFEAMQTGTVTVDFTVHFKDGKQCTKQINFKGTAINRCGALQATKVEGEGCRIRIQTDYPLSNLTVVGSNNEQLQNVNWNCQNTYSQPTPDKLIFETAGCPVDILLDVVPTSPDGYFTLDLISNSATGGCIKSFDFRCESIEPEPDCCEELQLETVEETGCISLKSDCVVEKMEVTTTNGKLYSNIAWGQRWVTGLHNSNFILRGSDFILDHILCFAPIASGVITVDLKVFYKNGKVCEKQVKMQPKTVTNDEYCNSIKVTQIEGEDCRIRVESVHPTGYLTIQAESNVQRLTNTYTNYTHGGEAHTPSSLKYKPVGLAPVVEFKVETNQSGNFSFWVTANSAFGYCTKLYSFTCGNPTSTSILEWNEPLAEGLQILSVYPNPSDGEFMLRYSTTSDLPVTARIVNLIGQEVLPAIQLKGGKGNLEHPIDAKQLKSGSYVIIIKNEIGSHFSRFTIH